MSRHPVTPMDEADVRLHLAKQTKLPLILVDLLKLQAERVDDRGAGSNPELENQLNTLAATKPAPIVLFDTLHEEDLPIIGRVVVSQRSASAPLFCVGSSGIEYALIAHWRETGMIARTAPVERCAAITRKQIIIVSGSCSPVTDRQIGLAVKKGFVQIACDSGALADHKRTKQAIADALTRARPALDAGHHVIFQTARGPADSRRTDFERAAKRSPGRTRSEKFAAAGETLGQGLAHILEAALQTTGARRAIVCGGDSSTAVARALGIEALEFIAPVAPGGPLCRVHAPGRIAHGCEIVFKGGQVGRDSFFRDLVTKDKH